MCKLIKSEFYRRLILVCFLVSIASLCQDRGTKIGFSLTGFEWFCVRQLMGGWAGIPLPFFVAEYMAAEFTNHSFASALTCGFTRKEIFRAKGVVCIMGLFGLELTNTIAGTMVTTLLNGFGTAVNGMTIAYMTKRFFYYIFLFTVYPGAISYIFAVITKSKVQTIILKLVVMQLIGSTTGRIWYILKDIEDPIFREIVHCIFEMTPLYQIDSLLIPEQYRTHQFWQYLLSCSVCLIGIYFITISIFKISDMQ